MIGTVELDMLREDIFNDYYYGRAAPGLQQPAPAHRKDREAL